MDRKKKAWLYVLKILQWVHSSGLKGFVLRAISTRKLKSNRVNLTRFAVEKAKLDQKAKEVDSLNFFKEHHWVFA